MKELNETIIEGKSVAELLKPRIKCIEPFLGMKREGWDVGVISVVEGGDKDDNLFVLSLPTKYPLNFKRLEWWEDRKVEDLPDYVKLETVPIPVVVKAKEYINGQRIISDNGGIYPMTIATPATEQEYKEYERKPGK